MQQQQQHHQQIARFPFPSQFVNASNQPQQQGQQQVDDKGFVQAQQQQSSQQQPQQQHYAAIATGLPIHLSAASQQQIHPTLSAGPQTSFQPIDSANVIPGYPVYSDQFVRNRNMAPFCFLIFFYLVHRSSSLWQCRTDPWP